MSVKVKPGRWRERGGGIAIVKERLHPATEFQWVGRDSLNCPSLWADDGLWLRPGRQHQHDLIEYLGPLGETGGGGMKRNWTISKRQYLGQDRPCIISVCERFTVSITEVTGRTDWQWVLDLQDTDSEYRDVQFFNDLVMAMLTANSLIYWRMGFSD